MRIAVCLLSLALLGAAEPDGKPAVTGIQVSLEGRQVKVGFELQGAFDQRLLERLESGLATGFVYEIELQRDHQRWFDRNLDESELQVSAMYNAVTREYLVNFKHDGRLIESRVVRDLDELERAMTHIQEIPIFTVGEVSPRWRLLVQVRAVLGSRHWLGLIPTRIDTDWVESRKFRMP